MGDYPKRPCIECGAPCTFKRCRSCFTKDKRKTVSKTHRYYEKHNPHSTIKTPEKDLN